MQWELEIMLLLVLVYAQIEMVWHVHSRRSDVPYDSILCRYASFSIFDYIEMTREEKGRIGFWFWVFVCALLMMVIIAAQGVAGGNEPGMNGRMEPDFLWPIL